MLEALAVCNVLPLSSLRLLVSPLQLMAAALWGVVQHGAVMHYGLLEDFITAVLDTIPELLPRSERNQLVLGLRAKVVLELCRSDELCCRQNIEPHLTRIDDLTKEQDEEEASGSKLKASVDNFSKVVNTLLDDPYEREMFYKETFHSVFGLNFNSALCALVRKFLMNLEKLLPVPSLDQTFVWLGLSSPVLAECGDILNQPEPLSELLQHHKQDYGFSPGPLVNDFIFSSLSGQQDIEETESKMTYLNGSFKEDDDYLLGAEVMEDDVPSVEVTLDERDTDPHDCKSSIASVDQTHSGSTRTFRCFVCGQTFCSLFELKKHIIPRCSADTVGTNMIGWIKNEHLSMPVDYAISTDRSDGQMCERSSRIKTCSVCRETFAFSTDLIDHMRAHTEDGSQIGGDCGEDFDFDYENYMSHEENGCKTNRKQSMDHSKEMLSEQKGIKECSVILHRIDESALFTQICTISCEDCGKRVMKRSFNFHKKKCLKTNRKNSKKERTNSTNSAELIWFRPCELIPLAEINKSKTETDSEPQINKSSIESQSVSSSKQRFKCTLCDETFSSVILMKRHYNNLHRIKGPFQCPVCKRSFVRLCDLVKHNLNKVLFQCNTCHWCFSKHSQLRNHKKKFNDTCATPYICEICGKSCMTASVYKCHQYVHQRPNETVCSYCGKKFSSKYCLQVHMKRHTGGGISCPICPKVFFKTTYFKRHMNKHNGILHPYLCEICGKDWPTKAYFDRHMVEHSQERPFKCDQCGVTYKAMHCLKDHFKRNHSQEKPYVCSVCGAAFRYSARLREHKMKHTGIKPHICSKCGRGFTRRYALRVHQQTSCTMKKL